MFATAEFGGFAKKKLVLVEVDFPQKKKQTEALKQANQALATQFKVEGYPTLILLDSEGKKLGELDYDGEGPKALIAAIEKYLSK